MEGKVTLTIEVSQKAYDYMLSCARNPSLLIDYLFSYWADREQEEEKKKKNKAEKEGRNADENK
jgi:hypothetical protein